MENLLLAWKEFLRGKRYKRDAVEFARKFFEEIYLLHAELKGGNYKHGEYKSFNISDPKPRNIHKAGVRDRLLHHAIHRQIYPFFDSKFIADSYSCRLGKGTLRAMNRFRAMALAAGKNNTRTVWVLKCDIRKFFASIDHHILREILEKSIIDKDIFRLLVEIIESHDPGKIGKGLPLGNLTSQLFANIYMNEFDQFVKHKLKLRYYIRYTDDFVILDEKRQALEEVVPTVSHYLQSHLKVSLNPDKVFIKTLASGVDFLGWVHFPDHRILRTSLKRKILKRIEKTNIDARAVQSYLGLLKQGNASTLKIRISQKNCQFESGPNYDIIPKDVNKVFLEIGSLC